jgi:hypothetical protein
MGGETKSRPVPKLRHYPTVPTSLVPGQAPISPPLVPSSSPPGSPPGGSSFFGSLFEMKSPTPSPSTASFLNKEAIVVPPLWNDLHGGHDMTP